MYSKWFHSSSRHYCVFSTVKIFSRPVFSAVLVSEPRTTQTKFFWKLWCEEIQVNQNSKENGRLELWTGWHSQFLMSAVRLESWFVEASCSFERAAAFFCDRSFPSPPSSSLSFTENKHHHHHHHDHQQRHSNTILYWIPLETNLQWEFLCEEKWQSFIQTQTGSPHDLKKVSKWIGEPDWVWPRHLHKACSKGITS